MTDKLVPVCAQCGSANVSAEPTACRWNVHRQEWEVSGLCDDRHFCDDCDQEVDLTWRLATRNELKPGAPTCGHSACSQHFIDTGEGNCVQP